jgi:hypothetical protein
MADRCAVGVHAVSFDDFCEICFQHFFLTKKC